MKVDEQGEGNHVEGGTNKHRANGGERGEWMRWVQRERGQSYGWFGKCARVQARRGKLETSVNPFVSKQAPQKLANT